MPNALTAIFGADMRPFENDVKRMDAIIAAQQAKAASHSRSASAMLMGQRAEYASAEEDRYQTWLEKQANTLATVKDANRAENEELIENATALKALNAERQAAKTELDAYNAALMANTSGLKTVADANRAENEALLVKSDFLKKVMADRKAMTVANAELSRLDATLEKMATPFGGNARAMNEADQEAWLKKLAAYKGISVEALKTAQAEKAAALEAKGIATGLADAHAHVPGLNLVLRETLVIFREMGRGNWARIPGSFSLVIQGLKNMRGELGIFGALFTLTGVAIVGSIAAIVGSFFLWEYRVKKLTEALTGLKMPDIIPSDIGRLSAVEQGWRKIKDAIQAAKDEANSANAAFEVTKALMDQRQGTEKRLLEIQKQTALDNATDPAERARIRAEYAQKEHDLEAKQQAEQEAADKDHIAALNDEQKSKQAQADAIKVSTEDDEKNNEANLKARAEAGTKPEKEGEKSQLEQDQATVEKLLERQKFLKRVAGEDLPDDDAATLSAAQGRIADHQRAEKEYEDFQRTKTDRDNLRKQRQTLVDEAAKAGAGSVTAQADLDKAKKLDPQILADNDKIRAAEDKEDETKGQNKNPERGYQLNSQQRMGAYASTPPEWKAQLDILRVIRENTSYLRGPAFKPVGNRPTTFGGHQRH